MAAPRSVELNQDVFRLVSNDFLKGVGDNDFDGSVVLLRRLFRLELNKMKRREDEKNHVEDAMMRKRR